MFTESQTGHVISRPALLIAESVLVSPWISVCDEMWPTGLHIVSVMKRWPDFQESNETVFALLDGGVSMWDGLGRDPSTTQRFAGGMQFPQTHPAFDTRCLFDVISWDVDYEVTVIDISGSVGLIARGLSQRYTTCGVKYWTSYSMSARAKQIIILSLRLVL